MNYTAKQMIPAIGQCVTARFEELAIECTVQDVKQSYGRIRLLLAPIAGAGSQWVELQRIAGQVESHPARESATVVAWPNEDVRKLERK